MPHVIGSWNTGAVCVLDGPVPSVIRKRAEQSHDLIVFR